MERRRVARIVQVVVLLVAAAAAGILVNVLLLRVADDEGSQLGRLSPRGVVIPSGTRTTLVPHGAGDNETPDGDD